MASRAVRLIEFLAFYAIMTGMDALIDQTLETLLHSAIWRSTWHMSFTTLLLVAVVAFLILAYRRSRRSRKGASKRGYRYRRHYRK